MKRYRSTGVSCTLILSKQLLVERGVVGSSLPCLCFTTTSAKFVVEDLECLSILGLLCSKKASLPPFLPDAIPVSRAMYGQGIGYILYDEMDCTGLERNLSDCRSAGLLVNDCQHIEDAGVLCRREHFAPIIFQNNVCVCVQHTIFY